MAIESALDKAFTAGLDICAAPSAKISPVTRTDLKRVAFRAVAVVVLCGLVFGALVLPQILHSWIIEETPADHIADFVAVVVFAAFGISLGVISGVYNFLGGIPRKAKTESPASHREVQRAIRRAKV